MTSGADANNDIRLELKGISKIYASVTANEDVDLRVRRGEIHALLGENGAGKSTLMKMIYGLTKPDAGEIKWQGETLRVENPAHARSLGIGMVFQHFSLFETLTVAENVALALSGKPDLKQLCAQISEVSNKYGLPVDPERLVHALSVGERQRVEIIRCLLQNPKLLIMDEPTSVLAPQAVARLFDTLRQLSDEGCSILYISHKLDEIQALCHVATVLRNGKVTGHCIPSRETPEFMARLMIGKELPLCQHEAASETGELRLQLKGLTLASEDPCGSSLQNIELAVKSGEIFGIAGVSGNGQQELLYALSGEQTLARNESIVICGVAAGQKTPDARRELGMGFVPEERLGRGAVPQMTLAENGLLTAHRRGMLNKGMIRLVPMHRFAKSCIDQFNVKCGGAQATAKSLSGGNLQKYILGREILQAPELLVVSQPTWGVDVGAAAFIRQQLIDLRNQGAAVLVISEELEELFEISDRIAVIAGGKLSPAKKLADTSIDEIGVWMSGMWPAIDKARGKSMLRLEPRAEPSALMSYLSPLLAVVLMLIGGLILFSALGKDPVAGFRLFFISPVSDIYGVSELFLKATPLMLVAIGLAVGFRANVWNIGAEGQLIMGAVAASAVALYFHESKGPHILVLMILAGGIGGMLWASIPALLKTRFNTNEILVSLMLVYVAQLVVSWLVHGPMMDPDGFNFPQSRMFEDSALLPILIEGTRLNAAFLFALCALLVGYVFMYRSFFGFQMQVAGNAKDAARYAGFSAKRMIWIGLLSGGAMAGLAGMAEVAGPMAQITGHVSNNYGFAAIIVAFVARLNPVGIFFASLLMALLYLGGEQAQQYMNLPASISNVFQGMLLMFLLGSDVLIHYRVIWISGNQERN